MDLQNKLEECPKYNENLEKIFLNILDAHTPRKTKDLHGNHKPHIEKNLHKAITSSALNFKIKEIEINLEMVLLNLRNNKFR